MSDFVIENGKLKKYTGSGGDVVIPEGVTSIEHGTFELCSSLTSIVIPASVTSIGDRAFCGCSSLTNVVIPEGVTSIGKSAFGGCSRLTNVVIPEGVTSIGYGTFCGCSSLTSVVIPASVTRIEKEAFESCSSLTSIIIPEGVTSIGYEAFSECSSLTSVVIPKSMSYIGMWAFHGCSSLKTFTVLCSHASIENIFGFSVPEALISSLPTFWDQLSGETRANYVLTKQVWTKLALTPEQSLEFFRTLRGQKKLDAFRQCMTGQQVFALGDRLLNILSQKPSASDCNCAATFMTLFYMTAPNALSQKIYAALKGAKAGAQAVRKLESDEILMLTLGITVEEKKNLPAEGQGVSQFLLSLKNTAKDLEATLKEYYAIKFSELPKVLNRDGSEAAPYVFAWLLTAHENLNRRQKNVETNYQQPGVRPEVETLLSELDSKRFQQALLELADATLGLTGRSKKMFLAYPICRYADEAVMGELCKRAPKWRSSVSGNEAPPLLNFRKACLYSNTRAAILLTEKYKDLDQYAKIRGTDAEAIRDTVLAEFGLDADGKKEYDLGGTTLQVSLQSDLTLGMFDTKQGKAVKSVPKKGNDEAKVAAVTADVADLKKNAKKVVKARCDKLFADFLSGATRDGAKWKEAYLSNALLRQNAALLVWQQEDKTFTLQGKAAILSDGTDYEITDEPIRVAHPIEMTEADITAWQRYFTRNAIKQPFAQVWEPAINPKTIQKDRYVGCTVPVNFFRGSEKHGIHFFDEDFHNVLYFTTDGCDIDHDRTVYNRHLLESDETFTLGKLSFRKYSRQVNHIITVFDRWTVRGRIIKDDVSVQALLGAFTLAQIMEFIKLATDNNSTNCVAMLLNYKNEHFPDFDLMEKFTLE